MVLILGESTKELFNPKVEFMLDIGCSKFLFLLLSAGDSD